MKIRAKGRFTSTMDQLQDKSLQKPHRYRINT